jgi:NADH-quinone oxidoreductase subunit C
MDAPDLDVIAAASWMKDHQARLMTMTGAAREDGETDIYYHYFLDGQTYTLKTLTRQQQIPSITPVTRSASWIEREIQDLFAVTFSGHPYPQRLILPPQLEAGLFRQPGGEKSKHTGKMD